MAGLTIPQMIKMILFLAVISIVILGVYMGFSNYIMPYFRDLGPSGEGMDLSTPYYQNLMKADNKKAILVDDGSGYFYISLIVRGSVTPTNFYFKTNVAIHIAEGESTGWDTQIGEVNKDNEKIKIYDKFLNIYPSLEIINGGERVNDFIYSVAPEVYDKTLINDGNRIATIKLDKKYSYITFFHKISGEWISDDVAGAEVNDRYYFYKGTGDIYDDDWGDDKIGETVNGKIKIISYRVHVLLRNLDGGTRYGNSIYK